MNKDILKKAGFAKEVERVNNNLCPFCNKKVKITEFRDELSRKEFGISGICQTCQDIVFKGD